MVRSKVECPRIVHGGGCEGTLRWANEGHRGEAPHARGTWSYRLDLDAGPDGTRRQKLVGGFATRRDAQAALNEALTATRHGTYVAPSRHTLAEFLEVWLEGLRFELAVTAWTNYSEVAHRYVILYLGHHRLELTPVQTKAWHTELRSRGRGNGGALSARSVQLARRVLHRALADAVRWHLLPNNPASAARAPKVERAEMQVWSVEEAARFLSAVAGERLSALWVLAMHTGLRRGEPAGLRWNDLDLDEWSLTVAQQRTTASYQVVVAAPNARSYRQLTLAVPTVEALRTHRSGQRR